MNKNVKIARELIKLAKSLVADNQNEKLFSSLIYDEIKDENQVKDIIQDWIDIDKRRYYYLSYLIRNDKIKDENLLKQSIQVLIDNEKYNYLSELIEENKIKDENIVKEMIQCWIDKEKYDYLYDLILNNRIKDENMAKQIIQVMIDKAKYDYLYDLIFWIKDENKVKQIIQGFIDKKQYYYLYTLIEKNKINQSLLTPEQKELLKKENPNIKLSKKLAKISTAKKLIELAKTLTC